MKPFKILCIFLIVSGGLSAQSIKIKDKNGKDVTGDTISVVFYPGQDHGWTEIAIYLFVQNNGKDAIALGAKKTEYNLHKDEYHSFCFAGMCFDSSIKISPLITPLVKGEIDSTFSGHFRFDDISHKPGVCLVAYTFYDTADAANSTTVYVKFNTLNQFSGIHSITSSLPKIYPNPTTGKLYIEQGTKTVNEISIYNLMGEKVFYSKILNTQTELNLNLKNGLYFYEILDSQNTVMQGKFILK